MTQAFPLTWPATQARTKPYRRKCWPALPGRNRFLTVARALDGILHETRLLGASNVVVSSNLKLRIDGLPRSGQPNPEDPGIAVYFDRKGKPLVFACDQFDQPQGNMRAIAKHLEALRGMDRWGVGSLDQAFTGYQELPDSSTTWWSELGLSERPVSMDALKSAYRFAAKVAHPDAGGTSEQMDRVAKAFQQGCAEFGGAS